jgi:hypothetical protein
MFAGGDNMRKSRQSARPVATAGGDAGESHIRKLIRELQAAFHDAKGTVGEALTLLDHALDDLRKTFALLDDDTARPLMRELARIENELRFARRQYDHIDDANPSTRGDGKVLLLLPGLNARPAVMRAVPARGRKLSPGNR